MEDEEEKWGEHRADDTDIVCLFLIIIVFTTLQNDEESVPAQSSSLHGAADVTKTT